MRRWIVVAAVLPLFVGSMVVSALAAPLLGPMMLSNWSKSDNVVPSDETLGLVMGNECQQVISLLRKKNFRQERTAKFDVGSFFGGPTSHQGTSYTFVGPNYATVLMDCRAEIQDD